MMDGDSDRDAGAPRRTRAPPPRDQPAPRPCARHLRPRPMARAGDFGFDPLMLLPGHEEQYKLAELQHGRAAMLAFGGVVTQSALPGAFGFGSDHFPYF